MAGIRACKRVILVNTRKTDSVEGFVLRFASEPEESIEDTHIRNYSDALKEALGYTHKIHRLDVVSTMRIVIKMEGGSQAETYYNTEDLQNERN